MRHTCFTRTFLKMPIFPGDFTGCRTHQKLRRLLLRKFVSLYFRGLIHCSCSSLVHYPYDCNIQRQISPQGSLKALHASSHGPHIQESPHTRAPNSPKSLERVFTASPPGVSKKSRKSSRTLILTSFLALLLGPLGLFPTLF